MTADCGKRSTRSSVELPGPQPRSTARLRGSATAPAPGDRAAAGCVHPRISDIAVRSSHSVGSISSCRRRAQPRNIIPPGRGAPLPNSPSALPRAISAEEHIDRRHHEQREQRADRQAGGDHQPHLKRDTAPAPVAVISGTTPSTMAAVVIRIGRSRIAGGVFDRLALALALRLQLVGELARSGCRAC